MTSNWYDEQSMPIRLAQVGLIFLDSYVSRAFKKISGISNSIQEAIMSLLIRSGLSFF